jgi:CheY-like chemotaxis protein
VHTLLLADESVTIQRVVELIFADEPVDVVAVGDGDEAIRRLDAAAPDIVLADVGMAARNGYELAWHVKHNPRLAHIPVVLLAGAFDAVDHERARAAGCAGILTKPLEPQLVIARVQELLAATGAAPDEEGVPDVLDGSGQPPRAAEDEHAPGTITARARELDTYFDTLDAAFAGRLKPAPGDPIAAAGSEGVTSPSPVSDLDTADTAATATLADTFAALLAGKVDQPARQHATPAITDEIVDEVARRVLAGLSERVVRETVSEIVSAIAERLVREEIERIKASIT